MEHLSTLSIATLAKIYNELVPIVATVEMPLAPIKKFSDKTTGAKRVLAILADANAIRAAAGLVPMEVSEGGGLSIPDNSEPADDLPPEEGELPVESPSLEVQVENDLPGFVKGLEELGASQENLDNADLPPETLPEPEPTLATEIANSIRIAPVPKKAAPKPVKNGGKDPGGRPPSVGDTDIITLIEKTKNPKRAEAARRFAKYKDGMTVAEYIAAIGGVNRQGYRDIAWDIKKKWISVSGAPRAKKPEAEAAPEPVEQSSDTPDQADKAA